MKIILKMKNLLILVIIVLSVGFVKAQSSVRIDETKLEGTIGNYKISMTLAIPYGGATSCFTIGEYYYTSIKNDINLCEGDDRKLLEIVDGKNTGYFILEAWDKKIGETVRGIWYTMDGVKSYPVTLKVIGKRE